MKENFGFSMQFLEAKDPIDEELAEVLRITRCTYESRQRAGVCCHILETVLRQIGIPWTVRAFGSLATNLGSNTSDLDASCHDPNGGAESLPYTNREILTKLATALASDPRFQVLDNVVMARIPLIKLRFDNALDVDLSCNNTEPFANTQYLRAYADLHPAVQNLLRLVKLWAGANDALGAKGGNLSSYSLNLMALYFMQVDSFTNLPCLPVAAFDGDRNPPAAAAVPFTCNLSLSTLLYRFFVFYACEFRWGKEVVAVHIGQRTTRFDMNHAQLSGIEASRLHIADPFLQARNLNCVLTLQQEHFLYEKLKAASMALSMGAIPHGLSLSNFPQPQPTPVEPRVPRWPVPFQPPLIPDLSNGSNGVQAPAPAIVPVYADLDPASAPPVLSKRSLGQNKVWALESSSTQPDELEGQTQDASTAEVAEEKPEEAAVAPPPENLIPITRLAGKWRF